MNNWMKNKVALWGILFCFLAVITGSGLALARPTLPDLIARDQTQNAISIQSSTVAVDFPSKLTFNLAVNDDAVITDIRLRYTVDRDNFASVFSESFIEFSPIIFNGAPGTAVQTKWVMDMQKTGGLPPGSTLDYWWVVKDASGRQLETTHQKVEFADNRFQWRSIKQNNINLYWYNGNDAFANQLMTTAQQALVRLESSTGAKLVRPIKIYIYANAQDLKGSMIFPAEWTGGVSFTEYAIIAIGISPSNLSWGETAIAHELTHLAVHQMTFNPYNELPTWLDEGLAVYNEGQADSGMLNALNKAISSKTLVSIRSLSSPFSAYTDAASLSYGESYSVVNYLITTYGQQKMLGLLDTFQQGSGYDDAFHRVYGFDMDQLNTLWKQKIGA
jgi:hypothetical protein